MRFITLACVVIAILAIASADVNTSTDVSLSMDMSSARDLEDSFLGAVQRDPVMAGEVERLGDIYCSTCDSVVRTLISKGCNYGCRALINPVAIAVCSWVVSKGDICRRVIDWAIKGNSANAICRKIGFCNRACQCGVCTPGIAGPSGRCLGAIRSCGNPYYKLTLKDMFALEEGPARNFELRAEDEVVTEDPESVDFCLMGRCDRSSVYGCCLTCL